MKLVTFFFNVALMLVLISGRVFAEHIYLARWELFTNPSTGMEYWRAPGGDEVGALDLRKVGDRDLVTPKGYGLFLYPTQRPIAGSIYFGEDWDQVLTVPVKNIVQTNLGLGESPTSVTLRDLVWDLYTKYSDSTGDAGVKPITGRIGKNVQLYIAGRLIREEAFGGDHITRMIDLFQADYRRNVSAGTELVLLRKWTGDMMLKIWGVMSDANADILMPPEYRSNGWQPPSTPINDDFETDTSANWTADSGGFTIDSGNSGYLEPTSTELIVRANSTLSTDDHYAQTTIDNMGTGYKGPMTRKTTSATKDYYTVLKQGNGSARWQFFSRDNVGGYSLIATWESDGSHTHTTGDIYKLQSDGSSHSGYINGSEMTSSPSTNGDITGNVSVGIVCNDTATDFEAFDADDLGGAPAAADEQKRTRRRIIMGR